MSANWIWGLVVVLHHGGGERLASRPSSITASARSMTARSTWLAVASARAIVCGRWKPLGHRRAPRRRWRRPARSARRSGRPGGAAEPWRARRWPRWPSARAPVGRYGTYSAPPPARRTASMNAACLGSLGSSERSYASSGWSFGQAMPERDGGVPQAALRHVRRVTASRGTVRWGPPATRGRRRGSWPATAQRFGLARQAGRNENS